MILCARSTSRPRDQSTKRRHEARTYERFVYSIVKIAKLYDHQTWQTHLLRNLRGAQRCMGLFFLIVLFGCWLARQKNYDQNYGINWWLLLQHTVLTIYTPASAKDAYFIKHAWLCNTAPVLDPQLDLKLLRISWIITRSENGKTISYLESSTSSPVC